MGEIEPGDSGTETRTAGEVYDARRDLQVVDNRVRSASVRLLEIGEQLAMLNEKMRRVEHLSILADRTSKMSALMVAIAVGCAVGAVVLVGALSLVRGARPQTSSDPILIY